MTQQVSVDQALSIALRHHQAGDLAQAESLYRQILAIVPNHPDALHLLGAIAQQVGNPQAAVDLVNRAIRIRPAPEYYNTLGNAFKDLQKTDDAIANYRKAIALRPEYPEAYNNLGTVLVIIGRPGEGIAAFRQSLQLNPKYAEASINLSVAFGAQGKNKEAIAALRSAIESQPNSARAHANLANALLAENDVDGAIQAARSALDLQPNLAEAHHNLAAALMRKDEIDEAIISYTSAIALKPEFADFHNNLGTALVRKRRFRQAIASYLKATSLRPDFADAWFNLGATYRDLWDMPKAIAAYRQAIALKSNDAQYHENLGEALKEAGQSDQAIEAYLKAIQLNPASARAYGNLGNAYKDQGRLDDAIDCYRKSISLDPTSVSAHCNLVYAIWFHPDYDGPKILQEVHQWSQRHAEPLAVEILRHANDRNPDRRLKIGYVSSDFREHPVGRFLLPLLANHNPANVEVFCYAGVKTPDAITARLKASAHVWRDSVFWDDKRLAQEIRQDQIDILVDLTLHMCDDRLLTFARKPAPVQVTYLGYAGTTGLSAIDYRLGDPHLDPPGLSEQIYSEKTIRLPHCYWCYPVPEDSPDVAALPALSVGHITFGCFNNFCKITDPVIQTWIALLQSIPASRLMLHSHPGSHRGRLVKRFSDAGIDPSRIEFTGIMPMRQYLNQYNSVDIALDPFPYGGGTTTCDALWMGVPTVTLAGQTGVGRGGVTLLTNVGLTEWIANDLEQYLGISRQWCTNLPALGKLRASLRQIMRQSPLMNGPQFTAEVEAAYRLMWHNWCRNDSQSAM